MSCIGQGPRRRVTTHLCELIKENLMRGLFTELETDCETRIKVGGVPQSQHNRELRLCWRSKEESGYGEGCGFQERITRRRWGFPWMCTACRQRAGEVSLPPRPPSCLQNTSSCLAVSKHTSEARGQREIQSIKFSFLGAKESGEGQGVLQCKGTVFSTYPRITQRQKRNET